MKKRINKNIRSTIISYIAAHGQTGTRYIIRTLAAQFLEPKQRIAGNISYLVTSGALRIGGGKGTGYLY